MGKALGKRYLLESNEFARPLTRRVGSFTIIAFEIRKSDHI